MTIGSRATAPRVIRYSRDSAGTASDRPSARIGKCRPGTRCTNSRCCWCTCLRVHGSRSPSERCTPCRTTASKARACEAIGGSRGAIRIRARVPSFLRRPDSDMGVMPGTRRRMVHRCRVAWWTGQPLELPNLEGPRGAVASDRNGQVLATPASDTLPMLVLGSSDGATSEPHRQRSRALHGAPRVRRRCIGIGQRRRKPRQRRWDGCHHGKRQRRHEFGKRTQWQRFGVKRQ